MLDREELTQFFCNLGLDRALTDNTQRLDKKNGFWTECWTEVGESDMKYIAH